MAVDGDEGLQAGEVQGKLQEVLAVVFCDVFYYVAGFGGLLMSTESMTEN